MGVKHGLLLRETLYRGFRLSPFGMVHFSLLDSPDTKLSEEHPSSIFRIELLCTILRCVTTQETSIWTRALVKASNLLQTDSIWKQRAKENIWARERGSNRRFDKVEWRGIFIICPVLMGGECSTHGRNEKFIQNFSRKPEEKRPLWRAMRGLSIILRWALTSLVGCENVDRNQLSQDRLLTILNYATE
jgi:hypothetical protein